MAYWQTPPPPLPRSPPPPEKPTPDGLGQLHVALTLPHFADNKNSSPCPRPRSVHVLQAPGSHSGLYCTSGYSEFSPLLHLHPKTLYVGSMLGQWYTRGLIVISTSATTPFLRRFFHSRHPIRHRGDRFMRGVYLFPGAA